MMTRRGATVALILGICGKVWPMRAVEMEQQKGGALKLSSTVFPSGPMTIAIIGPLRLNILGQNIDITPEELLKALRDGA